MAEVTSTVSVQLLLAGIERPDGKVTVVPPALAATAPEPLQGVAALGVAATTTPLGRVSMSGVVRVVTSSSGLLKVTVSVETPPALMVAGLKALPSVGGMVGLGGAARLHSEPALLSIVTAPVRAKALPFALALVFKVMLSCARILPANVVPVPRVAELPICQNTLQLWPLLITPTVELLAVVSVLPILKIKTASGSPWASRVRVPVRPID